MKKTTMSLLLLFSSTICFIITGCSGGKYVGVKDEVNVFWALDNYGERTAKANGMKLVVVGDITDGPNYIDYCLSFRSLKKMTLDEGRIFATNLVENFWQMIQNDPSIRVYAEHRRQKSPYYPKEYVLERVGCKIAFWDKDINRPKSPYLAEIFFRDKEFHYYEADPKTQELRLVLKEPYEAARRIIK